MSKSFKKLPNWNDGVDENKRLHHRRFRRINKVRVSQDKDPLLEHEVTNPYDIYDYNWTDYNDDPKYAKYKRK